VTPLARRAVRYARRVRFTSALGGRRATEVARGVSNQRHEPRLRTSRAGSANIVLCPAQCDSADYLTRGTPIHPW